MNILRINKPFVGIYININDYPNLLYDKAGIPVITLQER